jgi:hypothetical protein
MKKTNGSPAQAGGPFLFSGAEMNVFEFGDAKLRAQDIDPIYTALHGAKLTLATRRRYTLAYVAFDHAGLAARILEAPDFWEAMHETVVQTVRGAPRRYFRGRAAHAAVDAIHSNFGTPENCLAAMQGHYHEVLKHIRSTMPQFGPCAAFKIADMAERVCGNRIHFDIDIFTVCSNAQVQKGAEKACAALGVPMEKLIDKLRSYKWATKASPHYDRPLNQQEFETILCYYSHDDAHNKHMPGMDATGMRKELEGYGKFAHKLINHLPRKGDPLCL